MATRVCRPLADAWVFNTQNLEWTRINLADAAPAPREMASGTMISASKMLIFGGRAQDGQVLDDAAVLNVENCRWESHARYAGRGRCCHIACAVAPSSGDSDCAAARAVLIYGGFSGNGLCGDAVRSTHALSELIADSGVCMRTLCYSKYPRLAECA